MRYMNSRERRNAERARAHRAEQRRENTITPDTLRPSVRKSSAAPLTKMQRDSTGARSAWSASPYLRPASTPMTAAWSDPANTVTR